MASHTLPSLSLSFLLLLLLSGATTITPTFLLPLVKDSVRLQYTTTFQLGTPPVRIYLTVDLGNPTNWLLGTAAGYNHSSTYKPILENTAECIDYFTSKASVLVDCPGPRTPLCNKGQCMGWATNPRHLNFSYNINSYGLDPGVMDILTPLYRRDSSSKTLSKATLLRFPFVDTITTGPLRDLSRYSKGILTLAKNPMAIHSQISSTFKIPHKFAICLPSSSAPSQFTALNGAVYFGGGPYILPPSKVDLSAFMVSTKLINNTFARDMEPGNKPPGEYYFKINSIQIDSATIRFNSTLMSIDEEGNGSAKLSTMAPYTMLHSEIYKAFLDVFLFKAKALNMTVVKPVGTFKTCFSVDSIRYNATIGSGIPVIEIVMGGGQRWRIYGSNSMVKVSKKVKCLAIFDGGVKSSGGVFPSVVIGGKQMEDSLVEFDLVASKLRVASSLQRFRTSCSQFRGI